MIENQTIETYLGYLSEERRRRLNLIRKTIHSIASDISESMRYRMPTFERDDRWVSVASQKHYISIYLGRENVVREFAQKHPQLNYGKACIRIRDNQDIPFKDLKLYINRVLTPDV